MGKYVVCLLKQNLSVYVSVLVGVGLSYVVGLALEGGCPPGGDVGRGAVADDDYEPRINLAGKPERARKTPQKLLRPRYYSSELGIRERAVVGVLVGGGGESLGLASALNATAAHSLDRLLFFVEARGGGGGRPHLDLPSVVGLVDARPLLAPFHMLKYLTDNLLEEYEFFFLTRDTSYLNARALLALLRGASVGEDLHVGTPQAPDSSFCSLEAGLLLSNSVLRKVRASFDWCVKNAFSDSDNDNIGRCILHSTNLPCTHRLQDLVYESQIIEKNITLEVMRQLKFRPAITYYPVSHPQMIYQLHLLVSLKSGELNENAVKELESCFEMDESSGLGWPAGTHAPKRPPTRFDLLVWQYFDATTLFFPSEFESVKALSGGDLQDVEIVVKQSGEWVSDKYLGQLRFKGLLNGYRRFDPSRGLDYILDLTFRDTTGKQVIKRVEVSKGLGKVEMLSVPYVTENLRVNLVLPVYVGEKKEAIRFMRQFASVCMSSELSLLLLVLLYEPKSPGKGHSLDVFKEVKELALELTSKHRETSKITWVSIKVPPLKKEGPPLYDDLLYFAILDLSSKKLSPDSLTLFTQANTDLKLDYLNRVRMNTIKGTQVFSAIPFTEFNPTVVYRNVSLRKQSVEIHKNSGRFDTFNTKHISFYFVDYLAGRRRLLSYLPQVNVDRDIVRMFEVYEREAPFNGVRTLVDMFTREKVNVLRGVEPGLRLFHSPRRPCLPTRPHPASPRADNKDDCETSAALSMATRSQIASFILDISPN